MKGNEDICHNAFGQIRHWPPNGTEAGESGRLTKSALRMSALRRSKDINGPRNSVSWSSKVTCKTYSKDDPNASYSFNANASTSEGMNFKSNHLYDPHAQNEFPADHIQNNANTQNNYPGQQQYQPQQMQPPPDQQHFDQYYNTGVDYANQQPDPMYGDSQNQDANQAGDNASWGEASDGTGSYEQHSNSENSGSFASANSYSDGSGSAGSFNQQQNPNDNVDYADEDGSGGSYDQGSRGSGSHSGSFSTGSSASGGGLPPVS